MPAAKPDTLRLRTDAVYGAMSARGIQSLDHLAEALSISRATVYRQFSGENAPSGALIAGLALRLGLPLDLIVEPVSSRKPARVKAAA